MLVFKPIEEFPQGTIYQILSQCYKEAIEKCDSSNRINYQQNWEKSDKEAYDNLNTLGRCCWVSCMEGKVAGFFSYDPRNGPDYGIIGHNCVLPEFRRKGLGKRQIEKIIEILTSKGCRKIKVTTSDHPFYLPAQKMYESCGFKKVGSHYDAVWGYDQIDYERERG